MSGFRWNSLPFYVSVSSNGCLSEWPSFQRPRRGEKPINLAVGRLIASLIANTRGEEPSGWLNGFLTHLLFWCNDFAFIYQGK